MKLRRKLLAAAVALACLAATAQVREYEHHGKTNGGAPVIARFRLYDSEGEVGYRYIWGGPLDLCANGFIKMTKSLESGSVVYAQNNLTGCPQPRVIFKPGDFSRGWLQAKLPDGTFRDAALFLARMDEKKITPSLILLE